MQKIKYALIGSFLALALAAVTISPAEADGALHSLIAIIQGSTTTYTVAPNSPSWSIGINTATPIIAPSGGVSTSSPGTLASSTVYRFEIAALDGNGTSTPSAEVDSPQTDYGTTSDSIIIKWNAIVGAYKYQIYTATGTNPFKKCVVTTGTQYTLTSEASLTPCDQPNSVSTSFTAKISSSGSSYLSAGGLGIGTTSPVGGIDVASSTIRATSVSSSTCSALNAGAIYYNLQSGNSHFYGCNGTAWKQLDN